MTTGNDLEIKPSMQRRIRSFVVRAGRMTAGQERAWKELWPLYGIETEARVIDLEHCFASKAPITVEIGFGTGDALLAYARENPNRNCIGIEVHPPGVGHLLLHVHDMQLTNVRIVCRDAAEVLEHALAPGSLQEVHVFFPDPWHKKRHHKRRLIQRPFVDSLARVIKPDGILKLATDWEEYALQMRTILDAHHGFANLALEHAETSSGFSARPVHRPLTRFERRGHRLGHGVWDLAYRKK